MTSGAFMRLNSAAAALPLCHEGSSAPSPEGECPVARRGAADRYGGDRGAPGVACDRERPHPRPRRSLRRSAIRSPARWLWIHSRTSKSAMRRVGSQPCRHKIGERVAERALKVAIARLRKQWWLRFAPPARRSKLLGRALARAQPGVTRERNRDVVRVRAEGCRSPAR